MEAEFTFSGKDLLSAMVYGGYALAAGVLFAAALSAAVTVAVPVPEYPVVPPIFTQAACEEAGGMWDSQGSLCIETAAEQEFTTAQSENSYWSNIVFASGTVLALLAAAFLPQLGGVFRLSLAFGALAVIRMIYGFSPFSLYAAPGHDRITVVVFVVALLIMWYGAYYLGKVKRVWTEG